MPTMQEIYLAVRDAKPGTYQNHWEDVAGRIGVNPDDPEFEQMVKAMRVSGFLKKPGTDDDGEELLIGPTPLPDASGGGVIPSRRPRPGSTTEAPDRLRLAARINLWDDEKLAGSDYVRERDQGGEVCVAGVTKDGRPTVRVGVQPEDRRRWQAQEDDGDTVVLDPAGVGALERGVEEVIAAAEKAEGPYQEILKRLDAAGDRLKHAEKKRVGPQAAEESFYAQENNKDRRRLRDMWRERDNIEQFIDGMDESDRAEYDDQEARYQAFQDQAGSEGHVQASRDERRDARARQMVLVYPALTHAEAMELLRIQDSDWRSRPAHLRAREKEILSTIGLKSTSGVDQDTWLSGMLSVYNKDRDIDDAQMLVERVEASARPVTDQEQAEIDAAWDEIRAAQAAWDAVNGEQICSVSIPCEGGDLVLEATQGEEGEKHTYRVDIRRPGAPEDWSPGWSGNHWSPKPADLRKLAATARKQFDAATPPGWRPPPSGVPQV